MPETKHHDYWVIQDGELAQYKAGTGVVPPDWGRRKAHVYLDSPEDEVYLKEASKLLGRRLGPWRVSTDVGQMIPAEPVRVDTFEAGVELLRKMEGELNA